MVLLGHRVPFSLIDLALAKVFRGFSFVLGPPVVELGF